ncbi:hypothetical protein [Sphaerisporangium dianthi]|uniref:Uncharacterized protein n=1 Tax=Sphaerisporangium dianthi TaxID=1436120 RepID=A0ABV9CTM2_9ACTN
MSGSPVEAYYVHPLLAQIERDITPLRDALTAAIDHVQSFGATQASPPA